MRKGFQDAGIRKSRSPVFRPEVRGWQTSNHSYSRINIHEAFINSLIHSLPQWDKNQDSEVLDMSGIVSTAK